MNEITLQDTFDYSIVSEGTKEFLVSKENELAGIYSNYSKEVGKVCYEAQQKLADYNNDGLFGKWIESVGLRRQRAYEYIDIYKYAVRISDNEELEIFDKQPKSMQIEMSKPSADPELNQKVYDGDITTHKEYKELEKKLKEKDSQLEQAKKSEQIAIEQLEKEQSKEPEVIREQVEPDDYNYLKRSNEQLKNQLSAIEERNYKMASEIKKHETDSEKYRQLNEEMKKMNNQLTDGQKKLKAQKEVYDLVRIANQLITEVAPLTYLIDTENILDNEYARKPIEKIINNLRDMADRLDTSINQQIYEGEIINE